MVVGSSCCFTDKFSMDFFPFYFSILLLVVCILDVLTALDIMLLLRPSVIDICLVLIYSLIKKCATKYRKNMGCEIGYITRFGITL
jgi:hypothetical protein